MMILLVIVCRSSGELKFRNGRIKELKFTDPFLYGGSYLWKLLFALGARLMVEFASPLPDHEAIHWVHCNREIDILCVWLDRMFTGIALI